MNQKYTDRAGQSVEEPIIKVERQGFTLIELLVVISIIAILAAILFPVFARARENARRSACLSNTKQIALAVAQYSQDYDETLVSYRYRPSAYYGWQIALMPYIKSTQVFVCPSARKVSLCPDSFPDKNPTLVSTTGLRSGSYGYNNAYLGDEYGGTLHDKKLSALARPAETVMATEISSRIATGSTFVPSIWNSSYTIGCDPTVATYGDQRGMWHFDGSNIIFADGHAKFLKYNALRDYNRDGATDDGWYVLSSSMKS
jgi:prepilin-type N-terminal cleavage/methylation domain-containing protein/prepilin-type processing-associated H-X9-DG protein